MRVILCDNYDQMSKEASKIIASQIYLKPNSVIGFATGSTPVGTYKELISLYSAGEIDFKDMITFNLDEYYPISRTNDQSYYYFMHENLFDKINVKPENIHILNGEAEVADAECEAYDKKIDEKGGIDLQILGIGRNGHIGFNEPDKALVTSTHITGLTESTIEANSRFFADIKDVPTKSLTMGIASIMKAKRIIILANGESKKEAVQALLTKDITTECPATMLKVHPDVILICDKEAYGK